MTPADLRSLAADHAHIRHHPHDVADALVQAAEWIEHGQRRVAELIGVANALSVELRDAVAAERERWRLLLSPDHIYLGDCPDVEHPDRRDAECPVCARMEELT